MNNRAPQKDDRRPAIVDDDDKSALALLSAEIESRYGSAYSVFVAPSPRQALTSLEALRAVDQTVAVVLASQWMSEMKKG